MRIGVLGGTFDPPHIGHLVVAQEVWWRLRLDKVVFVPAGNPWHKAGEDVTPAHHREAMVRLAIGDDSRFELSRVDIERPGPTYTVDTLTELRRAYPPATKLYFILGTDALAQLPTWRSPERVISLARLAVVPRPGFGPVDLDRLEAEIPGLKAAIELVPVPAVGISSSEIARRVAAGEPFRYLVPEAVYRYIEAHRLYLPSAQPLPAADPLSWPRDPG